MVQEIFEPSLLVTEIANEILSGEKHQEEVIKIANGLSEKNRYILMHELTKEIHEWKHFLDFCGTTFGYYSQWQYIDQLHGLYKALAEHEGKIKIPFSSWMNMSDCPSVIRRWSENYFYMQEIEKWLYGGFTVEAKLPNSHEINIATVGIANGGIDVPIIKVNETEGYVIGAINFIESMAFNLQLIFIMSFFGKDYLSWWYKTSFENMGLLSPYLFLTFHHLRLFNGYFPLLDFAVSDYALMGKYLHQKSINEFSPGMRYAQIYPSIREMSKEKRNFSERDQLNRIKSKVLNLGQVESVIREEIPDKEGLLETIKKVEYETGNTDIRVKFRKICATIFIQNLKLRLADPEIFIDPGLFMNSMEQGKFPRPIASINRTNKHVKSGGKIGLELEKDNDFMWWWMIVSEVMSDIFGAEELTCPLNKNGLDCLLRYPGCGTGLSYYHTEEVMCDFGVTLASLKLDKREIVLLQHKKSG
jgi:hypothetical protein